MAQPSITLTTLDGQLGSRTSVLGAPLAVVGAATTGTKNLPTPAGRVKGLRDAFTKGAGVEAAAHCLDVYGRKVVFVRCETSVAGTYLDAVAGADGQVQNFDVTAFNGTSVPTVQAGATPTGAHDVQILFITGSVVGSAGAVYQITLDGGNTWSLAQALDTDVTLDVGIGVTIEFTNGGGETIAAGDLITFNTTAPVLASAGTLDTTLDGSGGKSTATLDGGTAPDDDYEVRIKFTKGGTIGVSGIEYQESLDDGRTYSPAKELGTANSITVADSGGITVDLSAGTVAADDYVAFDAVGPQANSADLLAALNALKVYGGSFDGVYVETKLDSATFDTVDAAIQSMAVTYGRDTYWMGNTRIPVGAESEATYLASLTSEFGAKSTTYGALCAGACEYSSSLTGRRYRRPVAHVVAAREASVTPQVNIADPNAQSLPCSIDDGAGNPKHHNESLSPGLDDQRFLVLRTWLAGPQGVFVNIPRIFSPDGSDFRLIPHRRVFNIAMSVARSYMTRRLNRPLFVDADTGFITETDAKEIELGMDSALEAAGLKRRFASSVTFVLSRDDNVLSNLTLTGDLRVIPLAYPEQVALTIGFLNPALQVQTA